MWILGVTFECKVEGRSTVSVIGDVLRWSPACEHLLLGHLLYVSVCPGSSIKILWFYSVVTRCRPHLNVYLLTLDGHRILHILFCVLKLWSIQHQYYNIYEWILDAHQAFSVVDGLVLKSWAYGCSVHKPSAGRWCIKLCSLTPTLWLTTPLRYFMPLSNMCGLLLALRVISCQNSQMWRSFALCTVLNSFSIVPIPKGGLWQAWKVITQWSYFLHCMGHSCHVGHVLVTRKKGSVRVCKLTIRQQRPAPMGDIDNRHASHQMYWAGTTGFVRTLSHPRVLVLQPSGWWDHSRRVGMAGKK